MAMFNFLINTLINIPMNTEDYDKDLRKIKEYPKDLVSKIINRKERRLLKREALLGGDIPGEDTKHSGCCKLSIQCRSYT